MSDSTRNRGPSPQRVRTAREFVENGATTLGSAMRRGGYSDSSARCPRKFNISATSLADTYRETVDDLSPGEARRLGLSTLRELADTGHAPAVRGSAARALIDYASQHETPDEGDEARARALAAADLWRFEPLARFARMLARFPEQSLRRIDAACRYFERRCADARRILDAAPEQRP